jgi:RNA recognition motif-containing protein
MGSSVSPSATSNVRSTKYERKRKLEKVIDSNTNSSDSDSDSEDGNAVVDSAVQNDDAPALSHAARRRQMKQLKRKQREEESDGILDSAEPKKKRKLNGGRAQDIADRDATRKNSVWIGNMTFKTTEEDLRAFFKNRGSVDITRVNMPTKAGGKPGVKSENRG